MSPANHAPSISENLAEQLSPKKPIIPAHIIRSDWPPAGQPLTCHRPSQAVVSKLVPPHNLSRHFHILPRVFSSLLAACPSLSHEAFPSAHATVSPTPSQVFAAFAHSCSTVFDRFSKTSVPVNMPCALAAVHFGWEALDGHFGKF